MKKALPFLFLVSLLFASCSVKRNNILSREYHGTTTHYNFYFNGRERMMQGAQTLSDAVEDKYDRVLSIHKYGTLDQAKAVFPDMDEAIKKVSIAISRHSIYLKGKRDHKVMERNRWIDDCYLVMGKSQFYKQDYWTAIETFQYTSAEYKNSPSRPEALLWLAKSYLELGKITDAEYLLDFLKTDKNFPLSVRGELYATFAQFHLMRNDVPRATIALQTAAAATKKKDVRARYYFIVAQLYQKQKQLDSAYMAYNNVVKLNPPYELAFNARINRARCYDPNSGAGEEVKKELNKMLNDEKNAEYKDQIYFALAGIAKQEKDTLKAIDYLQLSLQAGGSNATQKSMSYLELGDIYLHRPEYVPAAAYYDSCLTNLSNDHPEFANIEAKRGSLDRLVRNLKVIMLEDSLLALSALPLAEREYRIDTLIATENALKAKLEAEKKERQRMEEEDVLKEKELKSQPRANTLPTSSTQGAWYFYNESAISFGYNEFLKRWGTRKNEDHWRRSDKEQEMDAGNTDVSSLDSTSRLSEAKTDSISKLDDKKRRAAYLANIPTTPEQIKESNLRVAEAYYNAGVIYREQLSDYRASVNSFENLDMRYPQNKYKLPSYYNLYRTYLLLHDTVKADFYKDYLVKNHPESEYSKLILNPNFYKEIQRKTQVLEVFYENTYMAYLNKQYQDVIDRKSMADEMFPPNKLTPKFALLKAMAVGKTQDVGKFEFELEQILQKYPNDSVSDRAKELLEYIKSHQQGANTAQNNAAFDSLTIFAFKPADPQMFLLIFQNSKVLVSEVLPRINAFNTVNFQFDKLNASNGNLDLSYQYIAVSSFPNKTAAMIYFDSITKEPGLLPDINDSDVQVFIITPENLSQLVKTKSVKIYSQFFKKNYVQ